MNRNLKSILAISLLVGATILMTFFFILIVERRNWILLGGGVAYFIFTLILPEPKNSKYYKIVYNILLFPTRMLFFIVNLTIPIVALTANIATYLFGAGIWLGALLVYAKMFKIISISGALILYISVTFIAIMSIILREKLLTFVYKYGITRLNESKNMNRLQIKELTEGVITQKTVRFSIYFMYFIYLIIYSCCYIANNNLFTKEYDNAILYAFLTFLAFDNIILNCSDIKNFPIDTYKLILNSLKQSFHIDKKEQEE